MVYRYSTSFAQLCCMSRREQEPELVASTGRPVCEGYKLRSVLWQSGRAAYNDTEGLFSSVVCFLLSWSTLLRDSLSLSPRQSSLGYHLSDKTRCSHPPLPP